ncbi:MAG TPA: hypothetical protein VKP88_06790, partial [Candidatus Paceibacterota bacterium]|nr:hypothetical protein [Candidatus Paceibacterota bacterium]
MQVIMAGMSDDLLTLEDWVYEEIQEYALACCLLRTPVHIDERQGLVDEFPQPEFPMRVMKQLIPLAKALQVVTQAKLTKDTIVPLLWVGYSLSNDKRRRYLQAAVGLDLYGKEISARSISAVTGLHSEVTKKGMDQLQALGIITLKSEDSGKKVWKLSNKRLRKVVMRLDPPEAAINDVTDVF